jgi:hypothetical protein
MLRVVRRVRSPSRRAAGEAKLGGVAVLRRLAAIGAAYVLSDSRPVGADHEGAPAPLSRLRRNLIDSKIALDKGRALKPAGAVHATPIVAG